MKKLNLFLSLLVVVSAVIIFCLLYSLEKARRIRCTANLCNINLALKMYADMYEGYLPPPNGAKGLDLLRKAGVLTNPHCFYCPSKYEKYDGNEFTEDFVGYNYEGGHRLFIVQNGEKIYKYSERTIKIVWDKDNNHRNYGTIIFFDGGVGGFEGANWKDQK